MTYSNDDMAAILENPHALVDAQIRATDAHKAATRCDWIRGWFDEVWHTAKSDTDRARPARDNKGRTDPADVLRCDMVSLRGALEVEEIYSPLVSLPPETRHKLAGSIQGQDRADRVNAALATIPAGAEWLRRKAERDAARVASAKLVADAVTAEWEAGQPQRVLEDVEARGTQLSYIKPRGIMATGSEIGPEHVELIRQYRSGIEAILAARAVAAAPRQVV